MSDTEREEFIKDVFTTALYGGITYWANEHTVIWPTQQTPVFWHAVVYDIADDERPMYEINRAIINRGLRRIFRAAAKEESVTGETSIPYLSHSQARRIAAALALRDASDIDADDADSIVQVGLFGEVRYG